MPESITVTNTPPALRQSVASTAHANSVSRAMGQIAKVSFLTLSLQGHFSSRKPMGAFRGSRQEIFV